METTIFAKIAINPLQVNYFERLKYDREKNDLIFSHKSIVVGTHARMHITNTKIQETCALAGMKLELTFFLVWLKFS